MTKHAGGRPTKYTKDTCSQAMHYLDNYDSDEYSDIIPSIIGLALALNVAKSTIYDWSDQEDKKEFSDILEKIIAKQEQVLIKNGLKGDFNAAITKLVLGKHGYHDKVDSDHTTGGKQISNNFTIVPMTTKGNDNE